MSSWPSVFDALKSLRAQRKPVERRWTSESKVGFALSTRDRFVYTMRTIKSLDAEGGFDLIWNDGSESNEVPELSRYFAFRNARLVEVNYAMKGGADAAIRFGLRRLLELRYDFIGLIENDVLLAPEWLGAMRAAFERAAEDGITIGAVSALGYQSRVLEYRRNYSIEWARGAALALFTREAAASSGELFPARNDEPTDSWVLCRAFRCRAACARVGCWRPLDGRTDDARLGLRAAAIRAWICVRRDDSVAGA
jgi:GT2 family glycosyltransferase